MSDIIFPIGKVRLYPVCPECGHPHDQVKDIEDEMDRLKAENKRLTDILSRKRCQRQNGPKA